MNKAFEKEVIGHINKIRKKVEDLSKTDHKYQDSIFDLANFENSVRDDMKGKGYTKEQIEEMADKISSMKMENMELEKRSFRDNLTGLLNRNSLEEIGPTLVDMERREKKNCSVLMLDFDHFKRVNDQYGHVIGDHALQAMANILSKAVRSSDTVFRYGGEEFIVFLPNTSLKEAELVAEKIRVQVENACIVAKKEDDSFVNLNATISIGCVEIGQVEKKENLSTKDALFEMIKKADTALYKSKTSGRNKVTVFTSDLEGDQKK